MLPTLRRGVRELAGLGPAPWASARKAPAQSFAGRVVEVIQGVHQRFRQVRAVEIAQDHQAQIVLRVNPTTAFEPMGPPLCQTSGVGERSRAARRESHVGSGGLPRILFSPSGLVGTDPLCDGALLLGLRLTPRIRPRSNESTGAAPAA
jgi:hypothetical protein